MRIHSSRMHLLNHALISIELVPSEKVQMSMQNASIRLTRPNWLEEMQHLTQTKLDHMLQEVLASQQLYETVIGTFYGSVGMNEDLQNCITVFTNGFCSNLSRANARAGMGIFWELNARANIALRIPGTQTNNRAELYAILIAIHIAKLQQSLQVFSDLEFTNKTVCYYALQHAELG